MCGAGWIELMVCFKMRPESGEKAYSDSLLKWFVSQQKAIHMFVKR
jgi:hypothetical protein